MKNLKEVFVHFVSSLHRSVLAGIVAIAALPVAGALAAPEGKLDSMSLELGPNGISSGIYVKSADGKTWSEIKETQVSLAGEVEIEMKLGGRIKAFGIYL